MNRGSPIHTGHTSGRARGFNEAPIHESGKWYAEARKRKAAGASMRPRFMNRGSAATRQTPPRGNRLQ